MGGEEKDTSKEGYKFLGASQDREDPEGTTILTFKVWVDCLGSPTEIIHVPIPSKPPVPEGLNEDQAQKYLEELDKKTNDETDRRIKETRDRLRKKCFLCCELEWHHVEMLDYPHGERATYYNVQFKLTLAETGEELGTWTEWVRLPGGHTHYGFGGRKQINAPGDDLVASAKKDFGFEFVAAPPA